MIFSSVSCARASSNFDVIVLLMRLQQRDDRLSFDFENKGWFVAAAHCALTSPSTLVSCDRQTFHSTASPWIPNCCTVYLTVTFKASPYVCASQEVANFS